MGMRQRDWARKAGKELRRALGGRCVVCGTTRRLQFDCIVPQGDTHHKMEWSARISFYRRQHREKNLQLLCKPDHETKSSKERPGSEPSYAEPAA